MMLNAATTNIRGNPGSRNTRSGPRNTSQGVIKHRQFSSIQQPQQKEFLPSQTTSQEKYLKRVQAASLDTVGESRLPRKIMSSSCSQKTLLPSYTQ